ncbi:MAG TPA: hypothetical protein VLG67_03810 [Candidatus Saccharimonadales bacterium]|nr:hypothetical protein [Candidatus Saccharimonadales bacterium]
MENDKSRGNERRPTPKKEFETFLRECARVSQLPRRERKTARVGLEELAAGVDASLGSVADRKAIMKEVTVSVLKDYNLRTRAKVWRTALAASLRLTPPGPSVKG